MVSPNQEMKNGQEKKRKLIVSIKPGEKNKLKVKGKSTEKRKGTDELVVSLFQEGKKWTGKRRNK